MRKTKPWTLVDKIGGLALLACILVGCTVGAIYFWRALWPASRWYVLSEVKVDDADFGDQIRVTPSRVILRDFNGRYVTTVRSVPENEVMCSGGEDVPYRAGAALRESIDLDWWTAGAMPPCMQQLIPGQYVLTTCVFVKTGIPLVGERGECIDSNIFEVTQ